MQKFIPIGENVLVEAVIPAQEGVIYSPADVSQSDGIVLASKLEEIKNGDKIHFTKFLGNLSDTVRVVALKDIIAIER